MRIAIAGSSLMAVAAARPLIETEHELVAVLLDGRRTPRRARPGFRLQRYITPPSLDLAAFAMWQRIPQMWVEHMNEDELHPLKALDVDLILTAGFSIIFNETLLGLPQIGCVNIHPSLLPRHRGASPFAHAILAGDTETGVTFHVMTTGIDTGPVLAQESFPLTPLDSSVTLYHKTCHVIESMTADVLNDIEVYGLSGIPQDETRATYDARLNDAKTAIDWRDSAEYIERLVRAALAYYPAWFLHRNRVVHVTRATYDPRPVQAAPGTVLETRPYPVVATGEGRLIIHAAYAAGVLPLTWPILWAPLRQSETLPVPSLP